MALGWGMPDSAGRARTGQGTPGQASTRAPALIRCDHGLQVTHRTEGGTMSDTTAATVLPRPAGPGELTVFERWGIVDV
jgi:hypothetical protein